VFHPLLLLLTVTKIQETGICIYFYSVVLAKQGSKAEMAFLLNVQTLGCFYHFASE